MPFPLQRKTPFGVLWASIAEQKVDVVTSGSDDEDIRRSLNGDEDAYARLMQRYQSIIFQQMWRFTRDRTLLEELVQEVFVEVYMSLKSYKGKAPFLHWLRRIATRVGYRHWKRKARDQKIRDAAESERIALSPTKQDTSPAEAAETLHTVLAMLPPRDRLVLSLMYFDECSTKEIAERTGWSSSMVRVQAHRARAKLKRLMEEMQEGN